MPKTDDTKAAVAPTKIKVTMLQSADGQTRRVRIGDTEIPVLHSGPVVGVGQMNFTLTIADIELAYEPATDTAA